MLLSSAHLLIIPVILHLNIALAEADTVSLWNIGHSASIDDIQKWSTAIQPDGRGLPAGNGTVEQGRKLYVAKCSACHGDQGQGGLNDRLVGRLSADSFPFSETGAPKKTIGNYWPHATTVFDYIRRTMPYQNPGSLKDDEVYSLTAFLLYMNEIITADTVLNAASLPGVNMPAFNRFVPDNRLETHEVR